MQYAYLEAKQEPISPKRELQYKHICEYVFTQFSITLILGDAVKKHPKQMQFLSGKN